MVTEAERLAAWAVYEKAVDAFHTACADRRHTNDTRTDLDQAVIDFANVGCEPRSSSYARCSICSAPLDVPGRPWSLDCGGDCIACMADAGDPDCVEAVAAMRDPTALMLRAADDAYESRVDDDGTAYSADVPSSRAWPIMIDAALSEQP